MVRNRDLFVESLLCTFFPVEEFSSVKEAAKKREQGTFRRRENIYLIIHLIFISCFLGLMGMMKRFMKSSCLKSILCSLFFKQESGETSSERSDCPENV